MKSNIACLIFMVYSARRADAPTLTSSMRIALQDLTLDHLTVLYPGRASYRAADRVTAMPLIILAKGTPDVLVPRRGVRN